MISCLVDKSYEITSSHQLPLPLSSESSLLCSRYLALARENQESFVMAASDSSSIWLYNPNFPLAIVCAILYAIPTTIQFLQTIIMYKSYYFIVVLLGACLEVGGYIARAVSIKQPDTIVSYRL
jgi:hypothetical protein